jgi:lipoprotein-anchoring transpeptidase ErfK/SrfK
MKSIRKGLGKVGSFLFSRKKSLLLACALFVGGAPAMAAVVDSLIYDPNTKKWVPYTKEQAVRFYKQTGGSPEVYQRQVVDFRTAEKPGTIIIDGDRKLLYYVLPEKKALRYGIGVGKDGFGWAGIVKVGRKAEDPVWTPPAEMIARNPDLAKYANGMPGGPDNPLGPRALYLYEGGRDTIFRIHGTTQPWSIGLNASSGCIRLKNEDIIDLYDRVQVGSKVIVLMTGAALYKGV